MAKKQQNLDVEDQAFVGCYDLLRQYDYERYLTALIAPKAYRNALMTLYAFNFELAKTREIVSEPVMGQMRLQWWRDVIAAIYEGRQIPEHEVARPLSEVVARQGLSRLYLDALIDARDLDLDDTLFRTMDDLRAYAEATTAPLLSLALELGGDHGRDRNDSDFIAAKNIGAGYGLMGLMRAVPFHLSQGRCFFPEDFLTEENLTEYDLFQQSAPPPALLRLIAKVAEEARKLVEAAGQISPMASSLIGPPRAIVRRAWSRFNNCGFNPYDVSMIRRDDGLLIRLYFMRVFGGLAA